jgi:serine O-acetyltransferase
VIRSNFCRLALVADGDAGLADASDTLWLRLRQEAEQALAETPALSSLFLDTILNQSCLEAAASHRIASRLKSDVVSGSLVTDAFARACAADRQIGQALRADIAAVLDRDPACKRAIEPLLYFKGFHALQTHRLAHFLWTHGEKDFALYLQSRSSEIFQTDIHPAARFGQGIFLDHATGLVVGETTVVEDDVSLLQGVTLGGTGKDTADRHPKIRKGAMIGAGAKILGNIEVGEYARIAAGSVVLRRVDCHATVAGIPAKVIKSGPTSDHSQRMDQCLNDLSLDSFSYSI